MRLPITQVGVMNFFFMLGMTLILAVDDSLFQNKETTLYVFFLKMMPQTGYVVLAFAIVIVLFLAFVFRNRWLEIAGLFFSGVFSLFILAGYLLTFPNIGSAAFAVWTLASFMAIVEVLNDIQDRREAKRKQAEEDKFAPPNDF